MRFASGAGGFQQITSLSSAATLTVPTGAIGVMVQAESQNVRWRADGTAPTATVGHIIYSGDPPIKLDSGSVVEGAAMLAAIQFIETSASAKLNVTYLY